MLNGILQLRSNGLGSDATEPTQARLQEINHITIWKIGNAWKVARNNLANYFSKNCSTNK